MPDGDASAGSMAEIGRCPPSPSGPELLAEAERQRWDIRIGELDVTSQASVDAAVAAILDAEEGLDAVVHNAGHLALGYAEAFTPRPSCT